MRLRLATLIPATIVGVVALGVCSSVVALLSTWHIGRLLQETAEENLPSVKAAEELEIALLEQRGFVSSYILDGRSPRWLQRLELKKPLFDEWLEKAERTAHTSKEKEILAQLKEVYRQYDASREKVISLYDPDNPEKAAQAVDVFFNEVDGLFNRAYNLCEDFIAANQEYVDATTADAQWQITQVTWLVGICVVLTVVLGTTLLGLFFFRMLLPLRAIVADARVFAGKDLAGGQGLPMDELRAVGMSLQALMSDVAHTRSTLEDSRSRLMNAEKLALVGKLAAGVAHEIRNPLTSIKMWLFTIRKAVGADPELDRKFESVSEEIGRLETIIHNFLEFSRPPVLKRRPQPLGQLLDRTLELFSHRAAERKIHLEREDAGELPWVKVDSEQLKQVLINLLNNAAEATPEGGEIRISSAHSSDAEGRPMVTVRIRDTGTGMPDEVRARVFEPFFTTKEEGTGLGLCIAARITARHEGRLVLESSTADGSTFVVWIPIAEGEGDVQDLRG